VYARRERTIVLTERGRQVVELLRRQDALPADDEAGRQQLEREIGELLATVWS